MGLQISAGIGFFFTFNPVSIEQTKESCGCSNETCENHKPNKRKTFSSKNNKKFCGLCGSPMKIFSITMSFSTGKASEIMDYVEDRIGGKDVRRLSDILFVPEYAESNFAAMNTGWGDEKGEPHFMKVNLAEETMARDLSIIKRPEIPAAMEQDIDWAMKTVNGVFGKEVLKLNFGVYSFSY